MSVDTIIADSPPNDGRDWDYQCARCGSSCGSSTHPYGEDGGDIFCISSADYCESHPLPRREHVQRGAIEWFVVGVSGPDWDSHPARGKS